MKRLFAVFMIFCIMLGMLPMNSAQEQIEDHVFTEEDYAVTDSVWDQIYDLKGRYATKDGETDPEGIEAIVAYVKSSVNYRDGSLVRYEDYFEWKTDEGITCRYTYHDDRNERNNGERLGNPIIPPESGYEYISYAEKGRPKGKDVYLVGPYYGIDGNFTDFYKTIAKSLASATGGNYTLYSDYSATIDKVATAISNGAIVLIDSHGTYSGSKSYLRLNSGTGITTTDYNGNAYREGSEYMVTGTAIAAHMTKDAPNSFVWFGICSGMRFNTMHKPVMQRGVEATFGYSRTISFHYDRYWLDAFTDELIAGKTVAQAAATMKKNVGYWDRSNESATDTFNEAVNNGKAFPIFVSDEDAYPSSLQNYQTVKSTWGLYQCTHTLSSVAAADASCTSTGVKAHYKCTKCATLFSDSAATNEIEISDVEIAAFGHNYVNGFCTRCGDSNSFTLWHFWKNSPESKLSWLAVNTGDGSSAPTIDTTTSGVLRSVTGGGDHYVHMELNSGSFGHKVSSGDIIEVRYRTKNLPTAAVGKTITAELWYTTTTDDSTFDSSMSLTKSITLKENQWQTVSFNAPSGVTLKRIMFDFLQENNSLSGTTIEIDYLYAGPTDIAPTSQKNDELKFDFDNKKVDELRYAGPTYGDFPFDTAGWYVGSTMTNQKVDTTNGLWSAELAASKTSCNIRTASNATANENPLSYTPGTSDYFQARFKITGAQATSDKIYVDFYYFATSDNAWHYERIQLGTNVLGDYVVASVPLKNSSTYAKAGKITSIQMNISNFQSASGSTAKLILDYLYVGKSAPNPVEHEYVKTIIAPTCTADGYTKYVCSICGNTVLDDYVDMLGHKNTTTMRTEPTCTTAGEEKVVCDDCGQTMSQTVLPALGHKNQLTETIAPTCTEPGEEKVVCQDCGEVISTKVLPTSGHTYDAVVTMPTCTEDGYTTYICDCGDRYINNTVKATGHSYKAVLTVKPGCLTEGLKTYTCSCGDRYTEKVAPSGHNYHAQLVSANCTQAGYTVHTCENCGDSYQDSYIAAFGHDIVYNPHNDGTHDEACVNCTYKVTENCVFADGICACGTLEKLVCEHAATTTTTVEATCKTDGSITTVCDACGEILENRIISATGHDITEYAEKTATCTENGWKRHWHCSNCNIFFADVEGNYPLPESFFMTAALGHTPISVVGIEPTCTGAGSKAHYLCTRCMSRFFDEACEYPSPIEFLQIAATGHSHKYTDCGDYHKVTCLNCSDTYDEAHIDYNGTCQCGKKIVLKPQLDTTLSFTMNITVGAEMQVHYVIYARDVAKYESFYLEVHRQRADGEPDKVIYGFGEGEEPITATPPVNPFMYTASYTGVNAKEMGDRFTVTLYATDANGKVFYSECQSMSIKDYMMGRLNSDIATPEMKRMCVDMLKYGAAAQSYMNYDVQNLVTADLTTQQLALAPQTLPEATDHSTSFGNGLQLNTSIQLKSRIVLSLSCIYKPADPSKLTFVVLDSENGQIIAELPAEVTNGVLCAGVLDDIGAKDMRKVFMVALYEGGKIISKSTIWSIESYVAKQRTTSKDSKHIAMLDAMLAYGDSVAIYLNSAN
ncbi:MAG: hypothetical protein E7467_05970 [Ruminococcaceae bacterium]|nr:hypothetical protein [Oscillospiraceae bacterium]